ncbi:MAG TPA: chemotaxis protein CheB [Chthonomonadaceae bacterium]|nr:chemotaxis protein CheB [Chthonomonadaceae bacterium]
MAYALIVVGTSWGGLSALEILLPAFPADFPLPLVVVQHRSADSGAALAAVLRRHSALAVREPEDKEAIRPGYVYIAPADYHLLIEESAFALTTDAPVGYARPSIDVLFESAADAYAERVIGVVLTGASHDGANGAAVIRAQGGLVIAQDPATAESPLMPRTVIERGAADYVLPLDEIGPFLVRLCARKPHLAPIRSARPDVDQP